MGFDPLLDHVHRGRPKPGPTLYADDTSHSNIEITDGASGSREDLSEVSSKEAPCGLQSAASHDDSGECNYVTQPEGDKIQASALNRKYVQRYITADKALKAVRDCAIRPLEVICTASPCRDGSAESHFSTLLRIGRMWTV